MPELSIIIVSWNTKQLLRNCLNSIYAQTKRHPFEVIVVDNQSPDESAEMVRNEFKQVRLIANSMNRGFAAANNQGLAVANGNYFLLLNPDTLVLDGAIDSLLDYALQASAGRMRLGILTCKLLNGDFSLQQSVNRFFSFTRSVYENRFFTEVSEKLSDRYKNLFKYNHDTEGTIEWAYGAVMLFSRHLVETIGVLDERFYIYAEEMDYFMRARKAGFTSIFLPNVRIVHLGQSSSRQKRASMFIENYRSFYLFLLKHYGNLPYLAYRLRAHIYLACWYVKYSLGTDEESKQQKQVYKETIRWHYSKQGWNFKRA
ncbi:MAG: glycosyltransferase family 2 protein [Bacteroidota bacterium]